MNEIAIIIDGMEISGRKGMTIHEAALENEIVIPSLCHSPKLTPVGVCRVCVVEVEGTKALVGSCHTPIAAGMVVHTRSSRVLAARKVTIELLITSHTGPCVTCLNAEHCELHELASDLEVGQPRFKVKAPRFYPAEETSSYVRRDLSKCIMCRRCVGACNEIAAKKLFSIGYRGIRSKIIAGLDCPLESEDCRDCGVCIDFCPTGALKKPQYQNEEKKGVA